MRSRFGDGGEVRGDEELVCEVHDEEIVRSWRVVIVQLRARCDDVDDIGLPLFPFARARLDVQPLDAWFSAHGFGPEIEMPFLGRESC